MKIIIISDCHSSQDNKLLFNKIDVEQNFKYLLDDIIANNANHIFVLGDISQDGSAKSYIKFKKELDKIAGKKYVIMGNHDSINIKYLLSEQIFMENYIDINNHRFIFISSFIGNNSNAGFVSDIEFRKIELLFDESKHNYLLVHHHFIKLNTPIDDSIMENHLEFCNFINKFAFKAIFHGHIHNSVNNRLFETNVHSAPSTCIQFGLTQKLSLEPIIGYQVLNLKDNSYDIQTVNKNITGIVLI